jgi:hypothetical protein
MCPELALALSIDFDLAREQRMKICNAWVCAVGLPPLGSPLVYMPMPKYCGDRELKGMVMEGFRTLAGCEIKAEARAR